MDCDMTYNPLVSIIIPVFNAERFLGVTLDSVKDQTYSNWECICIDDCSTDNSRNIVKSYVKNDHRFKLIEMKENKGVALARNEGIKSAIGDYIAFLDSDDVWLGNKLSTQLEHMISGGYLITCSSYGKIDDTGNKLDKTCYAKDVYCYEDVLKNCPGNSTVIYNCKELGKIMLPDLRRRNDLAMLLTAIKKAKEIRGISEVLSFHRIRSGSLSYRKLDVVYYQYYVYRKLEKLSVFKSCYLVLHKVLQTLKNENG